MILDLKINCKNSTKRRGEILNLRNKDCKKAFREETDQNQDLLQCFKKDLSFWERVGGQAFNNTVNPTEFCIQFA